MWENKKIGDVVDIRRGASPRPIQNFLSDTPDRRCFVHDRWQLSASQAHIP